ncbi:hypothetical protein [Patulibacter sp. SYSU D01012]|uniref:hypothetical protein n=1 Tax=Patulibacter sp. SYSU D01012 TaxID=2817381 RepID=UPI001B3181EA|nr:hypothetical protein [Patulibacter sp. SYSU D01012]
MSRRAEWTAWTGLGLVAVGLLAVVAAPAWTYAVVAAPAVLLVVTERTPPSRLRATRSAVLRQGGAQLAGPPLLLGAGLVWALATGDDAFVAFLVVAAAMFVTVLLVFQHWGP